MKAQINMLKQNPSDGLSRLLKRSCEVPVFIIQHPQARLSSRSGMYPLTMAINAQSVCYREVWRELQRKSWALGHYLRRWGCFHYGSMWNVLAPYWSEARILSALPKRGRFIAHFLWAEFASPRRAHRYRRRGARLVGTFHASARRQPEVLDNCPMAERFDWATCVSQSQVPYLLDRGFNAGRIRVILHGVDVHYFSPGTRQPTVSEKHLRGLLVGKTERDHAFMAEVMKRLPPGLLHLEVLTVPEQAVTYHGLKQVTVLPRLDEQGLRAAYRSADLLLMPLMDCTANNAVLEAMACGTPVLANRVGGIPEYVDPSNSFLLEGKDVDEWIEQIQALARNRQELCERRPRVRAWAERFSWDLIADEYLDFYNSVTSEDLP